MSLVIQFPCLEDVEVLHKNKFKFLLKEEQGWVCFDKKRNELEGVLPKHLYNKMSDRTSLHDFINSRSDKFADLLGADNAEDYQEWLDTSLEKSLENAKTAQKEDDFRKIILGQFKIDFYHPQVLFSQGRPLTVTPDQINIGGTLSSYKVSTLNSLFYSFGHFLFMNPLDVKNKKQNHCINQNNPHSESIVNELTILTLVNILAKHYDIGEPELDFHFSAIADYEGSEDFFKKNLHLVKELSGYTKEDKMDTDFAIDRLKQDGYSPQEARNIAEKGQSGILHYRHKKEVIQAFFNSQLANKYNIDHIKLLFKQQVGYL